MKQGEERARVWELEHISSDDEAATRVVAATSSVSSLVPASTATTARIATQGTKVDQGCPLNDNVAVTPSLSHRKSGRARGESNG
jgi:hypothetical protein